MRITDLLDKRSINLNAAPKTKSEALDMAVELMAKSGKIDDIESYRAKVYAREEESTTGVGEGIAIPHGKCSAVNAPGLAAMIIKDGVDLVLPLSIRLCFLSSKQMDLNLLLYIGQSGCISTPPTA